MKYRKRLAAVILALAVFFSLGVNAYAEEMPVPTTEEISQGEFEQPTSIPEEDTTPPLEDPPASEEQETKERSVVYTIEELQTAIEVANDGDTVLIGGKITCAESVTIGSADKEITLAFDDDFSDNAMFCFLTKNAQTIALQNLVLNGETADAHNAFLPTINLLSTSPDTQGAWNFENVTFEKFTCAGAVIMVSDADATFTNCHIRNNYGRRGGIEIGADSSAEIANCFFTDNQAVGDGAAIRCLGRAVISNSTITGNTADFGGGISCKGTLKLCDTLICGNTGNLGGSDIRVFGGANIAVEYTDSMSAIYAENGPVGFYKDDFESTFNADTNAEFVGETLVLQNNQNNSFGMKFIFEGDLPVTPTPDNDSDTPPEETPNPSVPNIPVIPPVIEIDPNPAPEPDNDPVPVPEPDNDPEPVLPSQPDNPPEESEGTDTEEIPPSDLAEEESKPIVDEESTTRDTEETAPPESPADTVSSDIEKAEQDTPSVQRKSEDETAVDVSAPSVDSDIEAEEVPPTVDDEESTATTQPEQEEQQITVEIDNSEEKSVPWGIIITAVTLLSASGAVWLIKRKR